MVIVITVGAEPAADYRSSNASFLCLLIPHTVFQEVTLILGCPYAQADSFPRKTQPVTVTVLLSRAVKPRRACMTVAPLSSACPSIYTPRQRPVSPSGNPIITSQPGMINAPLTIRA